MGIYADFGIGGDYVAPAGSCTHVSGLLEGSVNRQRTGIHMQGVHDVDSNVRYHTYPD